MDDAHLPKGSRIVFQLSIFRCKLAGFVSGRGISVYHYNFQPELLDHFLEGDSLSITKAKCSLGLPLPETNIAPEN